MTVWLCVPKDSDGRTSELLRNTGLEGSSPAQKGAAHARSPGNLHQETGHGLPAFSENASKAQPWGQCAWEQILGSLWTTLLPVSVLVTDHCLTNASPT